MTEGWLTISAKISDADGRERSPCRTGVTTAGKPGQRCGIEEKLGLELEDSDCILSMQ